MSNEILLQHCAPTLAGLKIGNLFFHAWEDEQTFFHYIEQSNKLLNGKGIYFQVFYNNQEKPLLYVYRKKFLQMELEKPEIQEFLRTKGYEGAFDINSCLEILGKHLKEKEFPHEIGIFLGYPIADIKAFILNKGRNYKCVGCWKVYTNEGQALQLFQKFKKCTNVYCRKYAQGFDLCRLTVAS